MWNVQQHIPLHSDLLPATLHRPPAPAALKRQLMELQGEVAEAHQRLHLTQGRVEHNLQRISELKQEALALGEQVQRQAAREQVAAASSSSSRRSLAMAQASSSNNMASSSVASTSSSVVPATAGLTVPPPQHDHQEQQQQLRRARGRGLHSSLVIEEELKNHWFAVSFVSKLGCEVGGPPVRGSWRLGTPAAADGGGGCCAAPPASALPSS